MEIQTVCLNFYLVHALWGTRSLRVHRAPSFTWFPQATSSSQENQVAVQAACLNCYLVQATSSSLELVQRLAPTYKCFQLKCGESVSRSLTPASESPWHEA